MDFLKDITVAQWTPIIAALALLPFIGKAVYILVTNREKVEVIEARLSEITDGDAVFPAIDYVVRNSGKKTAIINGIELHVRRSSKLTILLQINCALKTSGEYSVILDLAQKAPYKRTHEINQELKANEGDRFSVRIGNKSSDPIETIICAEARLIINGKRQRRRQRFVLVLPISRSFPLVYFLQAFQHQVEELRSYFSGEREIDKSSRRLFDATEKVAPTIDENNRRAILDADGLGQHSQRFVELLALAKDREPRPKPTPRRPAPNSLQWFIEIHNGGHHAYHDRARETQKITKTEQCCTLCGDTASFRDYLVVDTLSLRLCASCKELEESQRGVVLVPFTAD